jgi:hypothetical protein
MKRLFRLALITVLTLVLTGCNGDKNMVTLDNVDEFKKELTAKLPAGTTIGEIEKHLSESKIEHSYVKQDKIFYAILPKIGRYRIIYDASLLIRIHLDDDENLNKIEFELEYAGL